MADGGSEVTWAPLSYIRAFAGGRLWNRYTATGETKGAPACSIEKQMILCHIVSVNYVSRPAVRGQPTRCTG
jgi:hypothetical protein